jgi:hypothetical protein
MSLPPEPTPRACVSTYWCVEDARNRTPLGSPPLRDDRRGNRDASSRAEGAASYPPTAANCDDGDRCTTDSCASHRCSHVVVAGAPIRACRPPRTKEDREEEVLPMLRPARGALPEERGAEARALLLPPATPLPARRPR